MDSEIFEKLPPTKLFFRCAVPSMITMAFGALYQIADGLFVGRFIGGDALAAVNLIMPIIMIVFGFANLIATGASVRIAVLLGEKNREEASRVFTFTLKVIFVISCLLGVLGLLFAESFVRFLAPGATEQAIEYGITYTRVYAAFAPLMLIYHATDNYLRVCGKEKISMWLSVGTQAFNIVLDVILIVFLGQGVWAAAFTSCLAMAFGSVITFFMFRKKRMDLYYVKGKIEKAIFFRIIANGSSEFFSSISMSIMSIVFNFFLLKYGGTTGVAAFSVIMYVDGIIGMLVFGMADSLQPAISYCYGAGHMSKVKAIFRRIIIGAIVLSAASLLFMMFLGQYVAPFFVKPEDTELLAISIIGMKLFSLSYLTGWVDMCFSSYFTALERPARSMLTSFFGTLVFPITALFILTPFLKLNGVWLSSLASCTVSAIFTIMLYLTLKIIRKQKMLNNFGGMIMITTERLILRPFTENDAADLFEYLHEPTVHCFFDMKISSMEEAKKEAIKRKETDCYFAIELKDTGKVIGEVFVYPDEEGVKEESSGDAYFNDTYSPCWMLNKDYHGKGYAYEAVKAVFDYLFNVKGARRLYAYTEDYNKPSQKLCEKLGMRREGLFIEFISFVNDEKGNPIYENTYQYAILKKEWK